MLNFLIVAMSIVGAGPLQASQGDDCVTMTRLLTLARIYGTADLDLVTKTRREICSATPPKSISTWPALKGVTLKSGSSWYYPNGQVARSGSTWYYPDGNPAKSGKTWYYPSREVATYGSNWRYPSPRKGRSSAGTFEEVQAESCGRMGARCQEFENEIAGASGDDRILALLELAWLAR